MVITKKVFYDDEDGYWENNKYHLTTAFDKLNQFIVKKGLSKTDIVSITELYNNDRPPKRFLSLYYWENQNIKENKEG